MAPKKGGAAPAADPIPADAPTEEEEDGPGKVAFSIEVSGITNLPAELDTCVVFGGACRPNRTGVAPPSTAPSGWEFTRPHFIRKVEQVLFDDLCGRELVISVRDAGNADAVVGEARLSLLPLLHDRTQVGGPLTLKLSPEYLPGAGSAEGGEQPPRPAAKAKGKTPPPSRGGQQPEASEGPAFDQNAPTTITVRVSVPELVGPVEDRSSWVKVTAGVKGIFALPETLSALNGGDVDTHPLRYQGTLLGEALGEGLLAKPPPADEAAAEEGGEQAADEMPEADWRSLQERKGVSVRFKGGDSIVWYRGARFIRDLQSLLNNVGGVWFYLALEEKAPPDPKKGYPAGTPDIAGLAKRYGGKAWFDLKDLIRPGVNSTAACCPLLDVAVADDPSADGAATLQSSRTFVSLSLELSREVTPPLPAEVHTPLPKLLPERQGLNKFPASADAAAAYRGAVKRTFEVVCRECSGGVRGGPAGAVDVLKDAGLYKGCKEDIRRAIIGVARERLRKDTSVVPGQPFEGGAREEIMSGTYTYLTATIAEVLDELRAELPTRPDPDVAAAAEPTIAQEANRTAPEGFTPAAQPRVTLLLPGGGGVRSPQLNSARSGQGRFSSNLAATPTREVEEVLPPPEPPQNPRASALDEGDEVAKAREALELASDTGARCKRLAYEAEILGSWERAAEQWQSRLLLEEFKSDPKEWLAYAKFCSRSRGRQDAAEEALARARGLLESGEGFASPEVELMLGCLLLDRGRHLEAIRIFRSWHLKDVAEPTYLFFLGLALFLAGEGDESKPLLEAVGKPRDWFDGVEDDAAIAEKLTASRASGGPPDPAPYAEGVGQLLDFGLSSLAFTFLDQCGALSESALQPEPFALLDARASAMDGDHSAAVERLKPLLDSSSASQGAWRLAGECYVHLKDVDRALPALQKAISFDPPFEDAAVYITLGKVQLAKKRWKQARESFVRSLQCQATAEAWLGVAHAELHGGDLQLAYEALCEANLLDDRRPKVWAQLCLLHLRQESWEAADDSCRRCLQLRPDSDCDTALQEVATEYVRLQRNPAFAEAAARRALEINESGLALAALSEALGQQGRAEEAVQAAEGALVLLAHQPDIRASILGKATKLCEAVGMPELRPRLQEAQRVADAQYAERPTSAGE